MPMNIDAASLLYLVRPMLKLFTYGAHAYCRFRLPSNRVVRIVCVCVLVDALLYDAWADQSKKCAPIHIQRTLHT